MLTLESVSYRYAGARGASLRDVSLALRDGEVVGIVGPSEAGKTTLALVASGLAPRAIGGQLRGTVRLDGVDLAGRAMHEVAAQVAIGFQNPATQLSGVTETVFEEVAFGPMNLGVPRNEVIARTWDALAALRIEPLAERDPARLSGGQQQLVAIAGLLALRPRHLVLDEPTAQLDPAGTTLVAEALATIARDGASICVVEQKTDLLAGLADRVAVMAAGRIAFEGPAGDVLGDPRLRELGVAEPAAVRMRRLAVEAALREPALRALAAALDAPEPASSVAR
jgi:energy-coupling factor transport system ATP-binding protein